MTLNSQFRWAWTLPGLAAIAGLGWTLVAEGQSSSGSDKSVGAAREMAALVRNGQCTLREAAAIAEDHTKGIALHVESYIELTAPSQKGTTPAPPSQQFAQDNRKPGESTTTRSDMPRLIYKISCFYNNKIDCVHVDAVTKKIIDVKEQPALGDENS